MLLRRPKPGDRALLPVQMIVAALLLALGVTAQSSLPMMGPLQCNLGLDVAPWEQWSSSGLPTSSTSGKVEVPCGRRILYDLSGPIEFGGGLLVKGHLAFADGSTDVHITTDHVAVQGKLSIGAAGAPLARKVKFTLTGTEDQAVTHDDTGRDMGFGMRAFAVVGGVVDLHGMPAPGGRACPSWVSLTQSTDKRAESVVVPADVVGCWQSGDAIAVTSSDVWWKHSEQRRITSVAANSDGTATLTLNKSLRWEHEGGGRFATEVALLSRRIVIEGLESPDKVGGHFIVAATNHAAQTIEGVELTKMGQMGTLGRYPMHLHLCGDVSGTVISSLSIHHNFQRCLVVHGSDNALLADNVAFDNFGHCYMLEEGAERGNRFVGNLGAKQRAIPKSKLLVPDEPEETYDYDYGMEQAEPKSTDDEPSIFWITNPDNAFEGNVAAGSEQGPGFWFEVLVRVRGVTGMLPGMSAYNPTKERVRLFSNNVAHSNAGSGVATYPSDGLNHDGEPSVFSGTKSFRNLDAGFFFHIGYNFVVTGALIADNYVGVAIDENPAVEIRDSEIIGISDSYPKTMWHLCPDDEVSYGIRGIDLHFQRPFDRGVDVEPGTRIHNVRFSNLGDATECPGSSAIGLNLFSVLKYFDTRTAVSGLTFDGSTRRLRLRDMSEVSQDYLDYVEKSDYAEPRIEDAAGQVTVRDLDGSLMGTPGVAVINNPGIVESGCTFDADANAYMCPGACYRAMLLHAAPGVWYNQPDPELEVTWSKPGTPATTTTLSGSPVDAEGDDVSYAYDRKLYVLVLPSGADVRVRAVRNGEHVVAPFIETDKLNGGYLDYAGACGPGFASFALEQPAGTCSGNLVPNGGFEAGGVAPWLGDPSQSMLKLRSGSAAEGGQALVVPARFREESYQGPTVYLPRACMRAGARYRFSAKAKLFTSSGGTPRFISSGGERGWGIEAYLHAADRGPVVEGTLPTGDGEPRIMDELKWQMDQELGVMTTFDADGWNDMRGELTWTQELDDAATGSLFLTFYAPKYHEVQLDDVVLVAV